MFFCFNKTCCINGDFFNFIETVTGYRSGISVKLFNPFSLVLLHNNKLG